jgi:hypothetical protein
MIKKLSLVAAVLGGLTLAAPGLALPGTGQCVPIKALPARALIAQADMDGGAQGFGGAGSGDEGTPSPSHKRKGRHGSHSGKHKGVSGGRARHRIGSRIQPTPANDGGAQGNACCAPLTSGM